MILFSSERWARPYRIKSMINRTKSDYLEAMLPSRWKHSSIAVRARWDPITNVISHKPPADLIPGGRLLIDKLRFHIGCGACPYEQSFPRRLVSKPIKNVSMIRGYKKWENENKQVPGNAIFRRLSIGKLL